MVSFALCLSECILHYVLQVLQMASGWANDHVSLDIQQTSQRCMLPHAPTVWKLLCVFDLS